MIFLFHDIIAIIIVIIIKDVGVFGKLQKSLKTNLDIRKNYQIECIALKISHHTNTYKTDAVFNKSKIYKTCSLYNLKVIRQYHCN